MAQTRVEYVTYGKAGAGNYGSTLGKQNVKYTDRVRDRVLELVKEIPFPDKQAVFNIGDYGTADGSASMPFIRDLIITLKEHHGVDTQFQVIYEDRENNDFNSLFKRLFGMISDPPSYMLELSNVYPLVSGINFRKQCVPSDSMHFIMSSAAVQWLSKAIVFKEGYWAEPDGTEEEKATLKEQARVDWESFLLLRSRELKHGGVLLIISSGEYVDDDDKTIQFTVKSFIYTLNDAWKSFRDSGKITAQEFTNTNLGFCMFNEKQLKSCFNNQSSTVYQSGLRLVSAEILTVPCVFYTAWKEKKEQIGVDDREEFAKRYVAAHRNWSNGTFLSGLSETRTPEEKEKIVDDLYVTVEKNISQGNPEDFKNDVVLSYLVVQKE